MPLAPNPLTPAPSKAPEQPQADELRVLPTLNADGTRRWLNPKLSIGRFLRARRVVAWSLIVIYATIPFIPIRGHPAIQLDLASRQFHFFGLTLLSTDTVLMAVLAVAIGFGIFLVTAMYGRVWCGWACPQTVYLEFVYRPIERLLRDKEGRCTGWRVGAKYLAFFLVSLHLSNVFLSYFVGVDNVRHWTLGSPFNHPAAFVLVMVVTALMMFDFCFFREQTCIVACPYGRIQSALLDRHSLIISYDTQRGEPRRPLRSNAPGAAVALPQLSLGDCINCFKCVTTCPTGIDIRDGLQMECIGCAQCIDACDDVMDKVRKPRGLIRYSSQAMMEGKTKTLLRARTLIYPVLLAAALGLFVTLLLTRAPLDVDLLPRIGAPFYELPSGEVANQLRLGLANRAESPATLSFSVKGPQGVHLITDRETIELQPQQSDRASLEIVVPRAVMAGVGSCDVEVSVTSSFKGATPAFTKTVKYHMLGPAGRRAAQPDAGGKP